MYLKENAQNNQSKVKYTSKWLNGETKKKVLFAAWTNAGKCFVQEAK